MVDKNLERIIKNLVIGLNDEEIGENKEGNFLGEFVMIGIKEDGSYDILEEFDTDTEAYLFVDAKAGFDDGPDCLEEYKKQGYNTIHLIDEEGGIPISVYF